MEADYAREVQLGTGKTKATSVIINHLQTTLADVRAQLAQALRKDAPMTSGEPSAAARELIKRLLRLWAAPGPWTPGEAAEDGLTRVALPLVDAFAVAAAEQRVAEIVKSANAAGVRWIEDEDGGERAVNITPRRTTTMDGLLSIREASKLLACSEAMLRKWIHQRRIPTVKVGRLTRIRQSDLEAWVRLGLQAGQTSGSGARGLGVEL